MIELVRDAGLDVRDWSNFDGSPSANPKYCYEWCFTEGDLIVLNIWHDKLEERDGAFTQELNMRAAAAKERGPRKSRALRFDAAVRKANEEGLDLRAIILDRPSPGEGASSRMLDPVPWHVVTYEAATGAFVLARGSRQLAREQTYDEATQEFHEGELRIRMSRHRKRERAAREAKIAEALEIGDGRLRCEVPGCGFDFLSVYGEAGRGYAQVHHIVPLSQLPAKGGKVRLAELAIVCANCHAMIHRGGGCREISGLIPSGNSQCSDAS